MVATVYWSLLDEDKLVDFLVEAAVRGDFVVNASNKDVLTEISYRLSYLTGKDYTAFRVYNKVKGLKMRYFLWQWLSSESGINWNRVTQALEAEDCVWERVLKEKPAAMVYRFQGERHWASLTLIFGGSLENVHPQGIMDGPNIDPNEDEIIVLSDDDDENGEDIHVENGGVGAVNGVLDAAESVAFVEGVADAVGNGVVGLPMNTFRGVELVVIEDSVSEVLGRDNGKAKVFKDELHLPEASVSSTASSPHPRARMNLRF